MQDLDKLKYLGKHRRFSQALIEYFFLTEIAPDLKHYNAFEKACKEKGLDILSEKVFSKLKSGNSTAINTKLFRNMLQVRGYDDELDYCCRNGITIKYSSREKEYFSVKSINTIHAGKPNFNPIAQEKYQSLLSVWTQKKGDNPKIIIQAVFNFLTNIMQDRYAGGCKEFLEEVLKGESFSNVAFSKIKKTPPRNVDTLKFRLLVQGLGWTDENDFAKKEGTEIKYRGGDRLIFGVPVKRGTSAFAEPEKKVELRIEIKTEDRKTIHGLKPFNYIELVKINAVDGDVLIKKINVPRDIEKAKERLSSLETHISKKELLGDANPSVRDYQNYIRSWKTKLAEDYTPKGSGTAWKGK